MFFVGKPSNDKDSSDYVPSIFVFNGTKLNHQKLSRYTRFFLGKHREKLVNMVKNVRPALQHIVEK